MRRSGFARALRRFRRNLYVDLGVDHRSSLFLAGAARSGTTWLCDLLNAANEHRVLFEPFNKSFVPEVRAFRRRQYLRPDRDEPEFVEGVRRIMDGRVRNSWIDQDNRRVFCDRRIVKEVCANLLLPWIRARFPEMPLVLLIRHPCAVALSRSRHWREDNRAEWLQQPDLIDDHLRPFLPLIAEDRPPFERHVIDWCVEHYVPLRMLGPGDIAIAFYEDLCSSPGDALAAIGRFVGRSFTVMRSDLARPSKTARRAPDGSASAILTGADPLTDWQVHVTPERVARAIEIVAAFGLDRLYGEGPMPRRDAIFERAAARTYA